MKHHYVAVHQYVNASDTEYVYAVKTENKALPFMDIMLRVSLLQVMERFWSKDLQQKFIMLDESYNGTVLEFLMKLPIGTVDIYAYL